MNAVHVMLVLWVVNVHGRMLYITCPVQYVENCMWERQRGLCVKDLPNVIVRPGCLSQGVRGTPTIALAT